MTQSLDNIFNNNIGNTENNSFKLNKEISHNILFNILYRYDINIDNNIKYIIDKFFNLNEIDEPYKSIFQNYMIFDKNNNLFWIILSLYFIKELELKEFLVSLIEYSNTCNIYQNTIYINDLKNKNKDDLIYILKDYINLSNLHMICFLRFFLYVFG